MGAVKTLGRPTGSRRADKAEQTACPESGSALYISSFVSAHDAKPLTKSGGAVSKNCQHCFVCRCILDAASADDDAA